MACAASGGCSQPRGRLVPRAPEWPRWGRPSRAQASRGWFKPRQPLAPATSRRGNVRVPP
eukprot:1395578-Prymnesium_polylepis.1